MICAYLNRQLNVGHTLKPPKGRDQTPKTAASSVCTANMNPNISTTHGAVTHTLSVILRPRKGGPWVVGMTALETSPSAQCGICQSAVRESILLRFYGPKNCNVGVS
jgi:hypothetical protein